MRDKARDEESDGELRCQQRKRVPSYDPNEYSTRVPPVNAPDQERLRDQAITESYPASDPDSPAYEAGSEPMLLENTRSRAVWRRRLRKATPPLIVLGSVALIALVAVYVLRQQRLAGQDWHNWRGYVPWRRRDSHSWRDYVPWRH